MTMSSRRDNEIALRKLDGIAAEVRDAIIDALTDMDEDVTNVRVDSGLIAFDVVVDGEATNVCRNFLWTLGKYADGRP